MESQRKHPRQFSFEFFPPKGEEGQSKLRTTCEQLAPLKPRYVSVTFGAGGSTQEGTVETISELLKRGFQAAPHLSCIGSSRESIGGLLQRYIDMDVTRIVALRGDLPSGMGEYGEFHYANELVEYIRSETADHFHIEVAAYPEFHPQAPSAQSDLSSFKRKVEAGANSAITQYFYNVEAYLRFVEDCERLGIDVPIVPGIMPLTNIRQIARFSAMCGAEIPRWIKSRLEGLGEDKSAIRAYGLDVTAALCQRLLDEGAPGLHFYTMNNSAAVLSIYQALNLSEQS